MEKQFLLHKSIDPDFKSRFKSFKHCEPFLLVEKSERANMQVRETAPLEKNSHYGAKWNNCTEMFNMGYRK